MSLELDSLPPRRVPADCLRRLLSVSPNWTALGLGVVLQITLGVCFVFPSLSAFGLGLFLQIALGVCFVFPNLNAFGLGLLLQIAVGVCSMSF